MSDTIIRVEDISKRYKLGSIGSGSLRETLGNGLERLLRRSDHSNGEEKEFWALKDINFEVKRGEVVGIIGKNGAGKSTLLKVLSRITEPTTGQITLNGRIASLLEVGTGFHPELTGRENIFLNGSILGMTRTEIKSKFDEIVDFSGVEKFLDTPVKHYSSGMYVRLAFAVAAHLEPEILVIDEVLAVGDAEFQQKCLGKMRDVAGQGRTVLFVSHNMGAVKSLCTRAIYLQKGQIRTDGEVDEVMGEYMDASSKQHRESIKSRKDRSGNGKVIITDIRMLDPHTGKTPSQLISGSPATLEISYEATDSSLEHIQDLQVGIAVLNMHGQFVTALNNKMSNAQLKDLPPKGKVQCIFDKVPFMYGKFQVIAALEVNYELADLVYDAFDFNVTEGDYFNSGYPNARRRQGIYVSQIWTSVLESTHI